MTETTGKQPPGNQAGAPELEELARRLLDLWQDQLAAVAADPDLVNQAARLMAALPWPGQMGPISPPAGGPDADVTKIWDKMAQNWMAQDWFKGAQGDKSQGVRSQGTGPVPARDAPARDAPARDASVGAQAAAAASGSRGGDLDELSRRLAGIEQRLGELAQPAKPAAKPEPAKSKTPAKKPRRT